MKSITVEGSSNSPWGKKLPKDASAITFDIVYDAFEDDAEFLLKGKPLTTAEQRKVRNNEALTSARNKAQQAAWEKAGYEKPDPKEDKQLQLKALYKAFMLTGLYTSEQARQMASDNLGGVAWESEG